MQQKTDADAAEIRRQSQEALKRLCLRCDGNQLERARRFLACRVPLQLEPDERQKRLNQPGRTIRIHGPLEAGLDSRQLRRLAQRVKRLIVDLEKLGASRFIAYEYRALGLMPLLSRLRALTHVIERGVPRDDPATSRQLDTVLNYVKESTGKYHYRLVALWLRPDRILHCDSAESLKRWHIRFRKTNTPDSDPANV